MPVRVIHGCNEGQFNIAGYTVKEVAKRLREVFNISVSAAAFVNDRSVAEDHVLEDGDILEFSVLWGHKGGLPDFLSERELIELFGQEEVAAMRQAGLTFTPHLVIPSAAVASWAKWLADKTQTRSQTPTIVVDIEKEQVTLRGKTYHLDREVAIVAKCLIDAKGEIRSTADIRNAFPKEPLAERLDLAINRKLLKHPSGIGDLFESVSKRGYRLKTC